MKRVLILGGGGFLGTYVREALKGRAVVLLPSGNDRSKIYANSGEIVIPLAFNAEKPKSLNDLLRISEPDVVLNCVAIKNTSLSTVSKDKLFKVNGSFPHRLAEAAASVGVSVVHISTDGVFSGSKGRYSECDITDATDDYGHSKAIGELYRSKCLTIRGTFIGLPLSRGQNGLIPWFLESVKNKQSVGGFVNYYSSGLSVRRYAYFLSLILLLPILPEGVIHIGGQRWNKFWLLASLSERLEFNCEVRPVERPMVDRTLNCSRFFSLFGEESIPSREDLLAELCDDIRVRWLY
ncbi:sugar nucleotide-binding protein [Marinobacter sp. CHS3-4]|uniref:sugar nucleotide-binding protein n=1 Tax=Marinobacter sp. CHS3-4 TaxID=3045174 RepID=UPI0024B5EA3A|nr:sugar nucleotide-binding protein [Marinobacter sp. CHS3-4]MDI9244996.1 sugar nucleotide-binding protein [Marinobacter sp. CHS3-4]